MQNKYLYNFSVDEIKTLLQQEAWVLPSQEITSESTNGNELTVDEIDFSSPDYNTAGIGAFMDLELRDGVDRILDIGGGRYDHKSEYLRKEKGIELLVWDPFNRTQFHNDGVRKSVEQKKVSVATSMSVLNVIPNINARLAHIITVKESLAIDGIAYFKIWPGTGKYAGTGVEEFGDNEYQANAYSDCFIDEIELVFGLENAYIHPSINNLIMATNKGKIKTNDDISFFQFKCQKNQHHYKENRTAGNKQHASFWSHPTVKSESSKMEFHNVMGASLVDLSAVHDVMP